MKLEDAIFCFQKDLACLLMVPSIQDICKWRDRFIYHVQNFDGVIPSVLP